MITWSMKVTHGQHEILSKAYEKTQKMNEVAINNLEVKMGHMSNQLAKLTIT